MTAPRIFGWLADRGGCGWYRIMQPLAELQQQGLARCRWDVRVTYGDMAGYDVVIGQRVAEPSPSRLWRRLAADGRHLLVYEVDDDLWRVDPGNPTYGYYTTPEVRDRITHNVAIADLVTVTTDELAERVQKINPRVAVLPNWVDQALLSIPRPRAGEYLTVGWSGSSTHRADIGHVREPLQRALRKLDVRVVSFGADYLASGIPGAEHWPWVGDFEQYYRRLAQFEVALAPLTSTAFNRSKSALRATELHALGIPGVYSRRGPYGAVVVDGVTGLLCDRPSDWPRAVRRLVQDVELRTRLGEAARERARGWTIQQHAPQWLRAYQEAM